MGLRWRLARLLAPVPIMPDPAPGADGVFVFCREGRVSWSLRADRFRLKSTTSLAPLDYETDDFKYQLRRGAYTRFVGTVKS